jgi:hypothetical protein
VLHYTRLQRLAMDKRSNLLGPFITCGEEFQFLLFTFLAPYQEWQLWREEVYMIGFKSLKMLIAKSFKWEHLRVQSSKTFSTSNLQ